MQYRLKYTIPNTEGEPSMTFVKSFAYKGEAEQYANKLRTIGVEFRGVSGIVDDITIETK